MAFRLSAILVQPNKIHSCDQPVPVAAYVEDHVRLEIIGAWKGTMQFNEIPPSCPLYNAKPRFNFACRVLGSLRCLPQRLRRNDVDTPNVVRGLRTVKVFLSPTVASYNR
jgi:hypothetical protein